ncbi:MAG: manganese efflux pump MntP family protein [Candidatus Sericytochromatia bacterium]
MSIEILVPALLLGFSLALDCFAIAISQGVKCTRLRPLFTLAVLFGFFQGGMLLLGHFAGALLSGLLARGMDFVAAALLVGIGVKMIHESRAEHEDPADLRRWRDYLVLSLATSLDALAGGLSLSSLQLPIGLTTGMVALLSFGLAGIGGSFGAILGERFGKRAELFGGLVLIALAVKAAWP